VLSFVAAENEPWETYMKAESLLLRRFCGQKHCNSEVVKRLNTSEGQSPRGRARLYRHGGMVFFLSLGSGIPLRGTIKWDVKLGVRNNQAMQNLRFSRQWLCI
jgi:hypothetical protein